MTACLEKPKDQFVTWDGIPTTWLEYVRRVGFQHERTEKKKRTVLKAELGRWDVVEQM